MSGYLELADGEVIAVRDGLLLGRVASCDVVIADTKASRRHARVIVESGVVEIEDMGSSNGTLLNGKPVERRMLRDGDRVEIGKTVVTYREGALPGRSRPAAAAAPVRDDLFDDDDLLGDGAPADDVAVRAAPAATPAAPGPGVGADDGDDDELLTTSPALAGDFVEFEDEVVEVAKAPPPRREEPLVQARAPSRGQAKATDDVQPSSGRILQYSKKAGGSGVLGDDLGQMSGGKRALLVLLVVAFGGGIVYAVMTALR